MTLTIDDVTIAVAGAEGSKTVLRNVSCRFRAGSLTVLAGKTGSGKSTLLQTAAGLLAPVGGSVRLEDDGGGKPAEGGRNATVGIVFQYPEHQLFARTVFAEFEYTLRPLRLSRAEQTARIEQAMAEVRLAPDLLSRSPFTLSGGEKRRLALALALVTDPDWLLLDEPTAGLDPGGVAWLSEVLRKRKNRPTGGIIVATHDLDAFFPIADEAVLLQQGRIAKQMPLSALSRSPQLLRSAGLGMPAFMRVEQALAKQGIMVHAADAEGAGMDGERQGALMTPEAMAAAIVLASDKASTGQAYEKAQVPAATPKAEPEAANEGSGRQSDLDAQASEPVLRDTAALAFRIDPRIKWLVTMLLSAGILLQAEWPAIGASAAISAGIAFMAGMPVRPLWRWLKPYFFFALITVLISGLQLSFGSASIDGIVGFDLSASLRTLQQFIKIALVMTLGLLFTLSTTQMQMKRALEIVFGVLAKWKLPVAGFALGASLLLRFIPVVSLEAERLKLIVRSRSASFAQSKSLRWRDVPAFVVPLILSVMQTAEDLALAMEARGYRTAGQPRTAAVKLRIERLDIVVAIAGVILFIALIALSAAR